MEERKSGYTRLRMYIAYACPMFASSAMNNLFVTYYLDLFMNVVQITPGWFFFGQLIFMAWNAINDPLFGWISDNFGANLNFSALQRRLVAIRYGGICWCIAFLFVWFAPSSNAAPWVRGIHFALSLCAYDGMLSLVEVNHSALLADITTSSTERATFNMYTAIFAGLGSFSSFFGHVLWDKSVLSSFKYFALFVATVSFFCFNFSANVVQLMDSSPRNKEPTIQDATCGACTYTGAPNNAKDTNSLEKPKKQPTVFQFMRQMLKQKNFWVFEAVYFLQAFDCTFEKNHFSLFLEGLVGNALSPQLVSTVISLSFLLPWVCTVVVTPMVQKYGLYVVMHGIFVSRIVVCGLSFVFASTGPIFACSFLLINRVMSEVVCRLCPLVMTDLVDEDQFLQQRKSSMSATIIGSSTFFGKISQSLAPMVGYSLFRGLFVSEDDVVVMSAMLDMEQKEHLSTTLVLVPLVCVILQFAMWSNYTLFGPYLKRVKSSAAGRDETLSV